MPNESQRKKTIKQNISKSEKELKRMISDRRAVIQGLITTATHRADFVYSAIERDRLYKKLREQYTHLNSDLDAWTLKTGESVSRQARKYVVADLPKSANIATFNEFSEKHLTDIIGAINPSTVDKQVAVNAKIGGMYDRDIQIIRQAVTQGIAQGAVEGLTNPQMADLMRQAITNKAGTLSFLDKRGRKWSADAYFGMLNRTIHAQVARESYNAMSTDAGYDLAMIEGGITAASLSSPSDPCSRWAGKIISLTGATEGYPTYQDAINDGMFHPNCAHFTRALTKSEIPEAKQEEKEIAKQGAEARAEVNKERKADGLTPNKYAGEDGKISKAEGKADAKANVAVGKSKEESEHAKYMAKMEKKYGDNIYLDATDNEIEVIEDLERKMYAKKNGVASSKADEFELGLSNYNPKIKDTGFEEAKQIIPVNEVDEAKVDVIAQSMKSNGWVGEPIVVVDTPNGLTAMTGSHRIGAGKKLDIEIPVYQIDDDLIEALAGKDENFSWSEFVGGSDDDRLEQVKRVKDKGAIRLLKMEIDNNG